jgi:hypothetical protein
MKVALASLLLLLSPVARAQEACDGGVCVEQEDLTKFVQLAEDAKCRETTPPTFQLDPITVMVDEDGRIYGSGSDPQPYKLTMTWCNYQVEGKGQVKIIAAKRIPKEYGFRFRPKAAMGYLPVTAFEEKNASMGIDIGVLLEPVYYHWGNLNGYVGVRSTGAGVGLDVTRNMGVYIGWAIAWKNWQQNVHLAVSFTLW